MSSLAETHDYNVNHNNITYISYEKLAGQGLVTLHFIGGDKLDVTKEEADDVITDSDLDSTEELIIMLTNKLDILITTIANKP